MPQVDHMWHWYRPDSPKGLEFSYLDRLANYQQLLAIVNMSSGVEVVDLSAI